MKSTKNQNGVISGALESCGVVDDEYGSPYLQKLLLVEIEQLKTEYALVKSPLK